MAKIAFLFPGQGAQTVGMGKGLVNGPGRRLFDEARAILGYDLLDVCLNGPAERLNATVVSQPALYVTSLAALEAWKATEPGPASECAGTAGLSLGEYTALVFAGAMSFADGLRVVQQRGAAMQAAADATPSGMVSIIGLDQPKIEELCANARPAGAIDVANLLCPGNIVVSGSKAGCDAVQALAEATGAKTIRLAVAGAFHTAIMKPADEALAKALAGVAMQPPRIPVWSNVDAQPHTEPAEIRALLVKQVLQPVLWEQSLRNLLAAGFDKFYEIGPGRVLAGLLKRVHRKVECQNIGA
ncbi:malonyl CoA-ACP transacylase [Planctomycetaceae bacterium SCGC AG-212-F19]|nr:malonyl CoA-ACP transacylase [Planctomycetaceae bacterium SCGC AG-212-F19]